MYNFGESDAYQRGQVVAAIAARDSIAWAPDSSRLAFVAAIDGPTSDVYILDIPTGQLTRASFGNAQAGHLHWSPDGAYVVHQAVEDYNIGRSGTDLIDSLWAASTDGSSPRLLIDGPAFVLGWVSPRILLAYLWQMQCDSYYFVAVDLPSAAFTPLWRGPLTIDWQADQDFTVAIPLPSYDTDPKDPWFEEWCSPPRNPAANVDLSAVAALPISALSTARSSTIVITSREGSVSFAELAPTMTPIPTITPIPTGTPTPRAPAPP